MLCPKCEGKTKVVDMSYNYVWDEQYRKRVCTNCGHTFYTAEFEVEEDKRFKKEWNRGYRKKTKNESEVTKFENVERQSNGVNKD